MKTKLRAVVLGLLVGGLALFLVNSYALASDDVIGKNDSSKKTKIKEVEDHRLKEIEYKLRSKEKVKDKKELRELEKIKQKRTPAIRTLKQRRDQKKFESKDKIDGMRKFNKQDLKSKRLELRKKEEEIASKLKEKKKEVLEKRQEFKERLKEIRDERKKKIAEKVEDRIANLNERLVERLSAAAERMLNVADKINDRAGKWQDQGVDVSQVYQQLNEFEVKVSEFKTKLDVQAAKNYVPEITDETSLGQQIRLVYQQLRSDFKSLRQELLDLRSDLVTILKLMASLRPKVTSSLTGTPTNQVTTSPQTVDGLTGE